MDLSLSSLIISSSSFYLHRRHYRHRYRHHHLLVHNLLLFLLVLMFSLAIIHFSYRLLFLFRLFLVWDVTLWNTAGVLQKAGDAYSGILTWSHFRGFIPPSEVRIRWCQTLKIFPDYSIFTGHFLICFMSHNIYHILYLYFDLFSLYILCRSFLTFISTSSASFIFSHLIICHTYI